MNHISKLPDIGTNIFSTMGALANEYQAINLAQGFPNFKSDQKLIDMVTKAMHSGYNQYAPMPGSIALRESIAGKFDVLYNSTYNPDSEITVVSGATQAIYTIISTFIRQDDEVIIFKPAYDCYEPAIEINGGKTISIQLETPAYQVNWDEVKQKINNRTKMVIINTPQNPSGTLFSKNDMLQLERLLKGTNIILLSDEVYEHIIFDNKQHQSACLFPDLKSRAFIVASFGKTFHNTGWKAGYCCAPKELMEEFRKVHQFNVFSVHHPTQIALAEYLQTPDHYQELSGFYQEKRDLFLELIKSSRFKYTKTQGTYFQVLDYSDITTEYDVDYAKRLIFENRIASIPLSVFNDKNIDNKVLRFCFAKTDDTLKRAAEVICNI
ncbi:aminotransferase class I/II-fold pyridoxal phosphate-dependent enzyme [Flavobacteriaceae bacterium AU392]|nr:aminotransferase class I/II-fold pyridoxal phosphate-dependent enzyme [Flavobacteriaceae bacterium]RKM85025.1 aminotransferase class I/II-fold pyridoxal phosphate-dependent enzyme [Flavobacteriaceae bacterium AU392]